MKLIKWCIVFVVMFVGLEVSRPYVSEYFDDFQTLITDTMFDETKEQLQDEEITQESSAIVEESRLKTLLTYLPLFGIEISDVEEIEVPLIESSEALTFTYHSNVFSLYQIDKEKSTELKQTLKESNILDINGKSFVGVAASDFIVLVNEVNDLPSLVESVKEVNEVLVGLGFDKVSLKFE